MIKFLRPLALSITLTLLGCATEHNSVQSNTLGHYYFDYSILERNRVNLIQVFDDGAKTYFQFRDLHNLVPNIKANSHNLRITKNGVYFEVNGLFNTFQVDVNGVSTLINRKVQVISQGQYEITDNEKQAKFQKELTEMEKQVAQLRTQLDTLSRNIQIANELDRPYENRVVVYFANNSTAVEIDHPTLSDIAAVSNEAKRLILTGYTDANKMSSGSKYLAKARAEAIKTTLVGYGVSNNKIRIKYHAAGGFAADNKTLEGKALNRRVEIDFRS